MKEDNNDYQEKLSNQIEQISKCIHKDNLSDKEKIQCVIKFLENTFSTKKRHQKTKNTFSKKVISKNTFVKRDTKTKNTFSKKVISKTPKNKTQKKMNNNIPRVPRVSQKKKKEIEKQIKIEKEQTDENIGLDRDNINIPITIDTIGLYINSIKNK